MQKPREYRKPEIADLGPIAAHTFMPVESGNAMSHKGYDNPVGDSDCELSSSRLEPPKPGQCP